MQLAGDWDQAQTNLVSYRWPHKNPYLRDEFGTLLHVFMSEVLLMGKSLNPKTLKPENPKLQREGNLAFERSDKDAPARRPRSGGAY